MFVRIRGDIKLNKRMMNGINLENTEFTNLVFEQLGTFAILNSEGNYIYVTNSWAKAFDCQPNEVIGRHVTEFFPDTRAIEAMERRTPILAHPISINHHNKERQFTSYIPIVHDKKVLGCIIQTIFHDVSEALTFSEVFSKLLSERNYYRKELKKVHANKYSIENIIGSSDKIKSMKEQICQAARSTSSVVIEGETGTGKELVAHSIHALSNRSNKTLIKLNCASIPLELAESELFGYEYGAFTGAKSGGKLGKFELADKSTLFLDEINHLSVVIQPKLLRALQEQEIERVGGTRTIPIDVRLITATNIPLKKLVEKKSFRSDLFYRLNVINIRIPPLRERLDDLPLLIDGIIDRLNIQLGTMVSGVDQDTLRQFTHYSWPGNIRELQNVIERAMNEKRSGTLSWQQFSGYFEMPGYRMLKQDIRKGQYQDTKKVKKGLERSMICEALSQFQGNKKKTAEYLGISRTLLYQKIKEFEL